MSKYRYYYLADNTHRKCLVAGNAADSHVYHQDHGDRANASWSFVPSASFPGFYHIVDRKHGLALVAGERYDGRCYHQALTGRDNELWFPEQVGDARAFCFRDKRHGRHLVTGNRYDGNIYHQDAAGRGNATWTLQLAAMGRRSVEIILGSVVGGVGTLFGPILGAFVLTPLGEVLTAATDGMHLDGVKSFFWGFCVAAIVLFRPQGLWPWIYNVLGLAPKKEGKR